jgi:drug/metabolite transporter (DMT)-like permease
VLLALAVTVLNAVGNTALAFGMKRLPPVGVNPLDYVAAMVNPYVAGGIALLILWLLTRMTLLSWADLTFALPLMALGYVLAPLIGWFVLHEHVNLAQWLGTAFIFAGCGLVGTTTHHTQQGKRQ